MKMFATCFLALLVGCQQQKTQSSDVGPGDQHSTPSANRELANEGFVVVIGDHTTTDVLRHLEENSIRGWTDLTDQTYAKLIIVAQDATQGLTIHDDILQDLKPNDASQLMWLMTNCDLIVDPQLLELEELEARDLLNQHGLPGDAIQFAHDFRTQPADVTETIPKGYSEIAQFIADMK